MDNGTVIEEKSCCGDQAACEEGKVYSTFDYISCLTPEQTAHCIAVRDMCRDLCTLIRSNPAYKTRSFSDRCISESVTCLESCCQYAIKAVCFQGKTVE